MSKWGFNWLFDEPRINYVGLRADILNYRLNKPAMILLYEIDDTRLSIGKLVKLLDSFHISYIVSNSLHGVHIIGLTPFSSFEEYGRAFDKLQFYFPELYCGGTLRLNSKNGEKQYVIWANYNYPVLKRLLSVISEHIGEVKDSMDEFCRDTNKKIPIADYGFKVRLERYNKIA
jgi:hypothetical protein